MTRTARTSRNKSSLFPFGPLWDEFLGTGLQTLGTKALTRAPALDVFEDDTGLTLTIELPGLTREDIDVSMEDSTLTISGEKKTAGEGTTEGFHIRERAHGRFSRKLTVPNSVDTQSAEATYELGVLTIKLPKSEQLKPRQIEIN